jgi:spore germination protein KC
MILKIFPVLLVILLLSGCWDKVELNDVSIITGIAIEKGESAQYKMSVSSINSTELTKTSATGNTPSTVFSLEGDSVSELSNKMNIGITRKQIYSHTRIVVIDEEIAELGMLEFLDFLERSGEFRNDFNILISKGVKASDILKITFSVQKDPSMKIHSQAQTLLNEWGGDPSVRLTDFISSLVTEGRHPVASVVSIQGDPKKGASVDNNKMLDPDAIVTINGLGIFKHDKLMGVLSMEDTRSYLWTEDLKQTNLSVPCGEEVEDIKKFNDIRVISTSSKKETKYNNGRAELIVKVIGEADLVGTHCIDPITKSETFEKYEKQAEEFIEHEITKTIKKVQEEYEIDIFGFGESLNRSNHKTFKKIKKDWDQYFTEAEVKVDANIFLRRSGIRNNSFIKDLEELKKSSENMDE